MIKKTLAILLVSLFFSILAFSTHNAEANHVWGSYHWARTANPFSLKLGNNLSTAWSGFLQTASADWTLASVLDTTVVTGQSNPKNCRPVAGRVEVCNSKYGSNGWLGIAQIWVNGSHITQGTTKLNDTYFSTPKYNTPAWKQFVVCQEIGHAFGLNHQDENFSNTNLGSCMDYTSDPTGTQGTNGILGNEHPNAHDYEELGIIYAHLDTSNTNLNLKNSSPAPVGNDNDVSNASDWGKEIRKSKDGHGSLYVKDLDKNKKVFTFVIWAN